jgi:hypothetical protein
VTLNGQQHTSNGVRFDWFVPPTISAVYPLHGPTAGGTQILVTGTGFQDYGRVSVWQSTQHDLRCRFGPSLLAPTTFVTHESVACTSPPLSALGSNGTISFRFDTQPNSSSLMGSSLVDDGVLKLTEARPYQVGSFVVAPHLNTEIVPDSR